VAAIERQHGLQALAIEHLAARLAGGFLQPINSDSLKEAIGEAIAVDLGEFNDIKTLPGFPRAGAATLEKAWAADLKFTELAKTSVALVHSRIDAVTRLEAQVLKRLPPSMRRPANLVDLALQHLRHAKTLFGTIRVLGRTEMSPVWRPFLAALKDVTDVEWIAGPRQVPAWARALGIAVLDRGTCDEDRSDYADQPGGGGRRSFRYDRDRRNRRDQRLYARAHQIAGVNRQAFR
jgi:hypothetical protein